jgi:hypothetical protein
MSDDEVVARLTEDGTPLETYFLLGDPRQQTVAIWHPRNGVMACLIEDGNLARSCARVLRKHGAREFHSPREVHAVARQESWPNWEKFQQRERLAQPDRPRD